MPNARVTLPRSWHQMDTRIWNFEFRTKFSRANKQPKQVRCIEKVMRWYPNHTQWHPNHINECYTTSYWEYDAFQLGHERRQEIKRWYKMDIYMNKFLYEVDKSTDLLYGQITMTRVKRVSYSHLAVFADTVVPSQFHRTIIRWLHDGIVMASPSHVALLRPSVIFLFPPYCLREAKMHNATDDHTKLRRRMTRLEKIPSRWPFEGQDGHTHSTRKSTITLSSGKSLACQRFLKPSRSSCRTEKLNRWSYDGIRFPPSDPNLNISIFVCPSGVNFGTVWRLH